MTDQRRPRSRDLGVLIGLLAGPGALAHITVSNVVVTGGNLGLLAPQTLASLSDLARRLSAPPPEDKRVMRDDIDPQLLPIFLEEAQELVPAIAHEQADRRDKLATVSHPILSGSEPGVIDHGRRTVGRV